MKKTQNTTAEESVDLNYKQLAKIKYLSHQCKELSDLRARLSDISLRSKQLLGLCSNSKKQTDSEVMIS
jgi:hypothetical protein